MITSSVAVDYACIFKFWQYVIKSNDDNCWPWLGYLNPAGYGTIRYRKTMLLASRVSYFIHYKFDPIGFYVLHDCDNPPCVNPHCLFIGNQADNQRDCQSKKRRAEQNGNNNGETNARSQVSNEEADEIRAKHLLGASHRELAKQYPISKTAIGYICQGKTYKEFSN